MAKFHWRLLYPDGRKCDEPAGDASIRIADRGPSEIQILGPSWQPIVRVPLEPGYCPIFYRRRSSDFGFAGARTDAVVFGSMRQNGSTREGTLFLVTPSGQVVDCPVEHVDLVQADSQYEYFGL